MAMNVVFKGIRDGLVVILPEGPADQAIDAMLLRMEQNRAFFEGGNCPLYISGDMTEETLQGLRALLLERFGILKVDRVTPRRQAEADRMGAQAQTAPGLTTGREGLSLTVEGTVRNGQRISYQGDIIVLGDCNPGSQLVAGGHILVMGALRGMAHAGALGEDDRCIAAFTLMPTQIRIASYIARPPEGAKRPEVPQMAKVRDGHIEIANLSARVLGGLR